ncbi:XRE family transcriptional regulator [Fervidicella metallireducens AeB]|uniref:XRE family transcriptional regulator n=1 Tax=Fervidicella metallireducens AeB TaxID=1403537 RepID=A0A017RTZ9_9CLOT|nr:helix-turn-helix transcriptional regulator [Fervidicella metallireducens]EYE88248.1 XRE family transcriptional regulator [Fervidicella metallireducens AeB]
MIKIYLSRLLGERRMTQADLARKTGIRPTTINDIYHEMAERVNLEHLDLICEVLGCDLTELMEYIPNKIPKTGKNLVKKPKRKNKKEN